MRLGPAFLGPALLGPALLGLVLLGLAAVAGPVAAQTVALQPPPADYAAGPSQTGHLEAELVPETRGVAPGGLAYVAIRQDIAKGWHTYWRNPGDSGEATSAKWTLPKGWSVGDWAWPAPQRLPLGPLMNYGYTGQVLLPIALNVPGDAKPGTTQTLKADVTFLVCADICVPEEAKLKIDVPVVSGTPPLDPKWGAAIDKTLHDAPKASGLEAAVAFAGQGEGRVLKLGVVGDGVKGLDLSHAYFFPYDPKALDHAAKQLIEKGPGGLTLTLKPSPVGAEATVPSLNGVLSLGGARVYEVSATPGPIPAEAGGQGAVTPAPLQAEAVAQSTAGQAIPPPPGANIGLFAAIAFAVVGGLILNLMPCVFPVLSMKAASLAAHAHQEKEARSQGLAFLAGVLATFLALAGLLLAAKAGGQAIGWGFQLQSPAVVGGLALVMLLVALNMSGVFEATLPGQGAGGALAARGGLVGSFFTGMLAVVVAAPCTAPFMATALGFALTQSAPAALLVFAGLGLGFAAPFVAVTFIPALMRLFPRPGAWMDTLKHLLAFPMYGTAAWLLWVFTLQTGSGALALMLAAAVLVGFGGWLVGRAQASGKPLIPGLAAGLAAVLAIACLVYGARETAPAAAAQTASADPAVPAEAGGQEAASQPFSTQALADLRAQGRPVFVNFTAAWCVTCQVNERLALGSPQVAKALAEVGGVYLKADWTNHNGEIAKLLAEHGRAGVPLYLVYGAGGGDPAVLPQLLTPGAVAQAIRAAGKKT
jgi:thiol:disulfide interchange protein DsbD